MANVLLTQFDVLNPKETEPKSVVTTVPNQRATVAVLPCGCNNGAPVD